MPDQPLSCRRRLFCPSRRGRATKFTRAALFRRRRHPPRGRVARARPVLPHRPRHHDRRCADFPARGGSRTRAERALPRRGEREKIFLVTKLPPSNASRKGVVRSCEASLKRLKTDRVELYLLHWCFKQGISVMAYSPVEQ